jgi:hypothetical protein
MLSFLNQVLIALLVFFVFGLFIYNSVISFKRAKKDLVDQDFSHGSRAYVVFRMISSGIIIAWFTFLILVFLQMLITKWRPW